MKQSCFPDNKIQGPQPKETMIRAEFFCDLYKTPQQRQRQRDAENDKAFSDSFSLFTLQHNRIKVTISQFMKLRLEGDLLCRF